MPLFSKTKKKEPQLEELDSDKLNETKKLADDLVRQHMAGVTRSDYWNVVINILIELHPEIGTHPKVVEFMDRLTKYQNSHKEERQCH